MSKYKIGDLFHVLNEFWEGRNMFAASKQGVGAHPGLIKLKRRDNYTYQLAPGTTKKYFTERKNNCVYKTSFENIDHAYYLLFLSVPVTEDELKYFNSGWKGDKSLNSLQLSQLIQQLFLCNGFKVSD